MSTRVLPPITIRPMHQRHGPLRVALVAEVRPFEAEA
jgi:hypothetical protein